MIVFGEICETTQGVQIPKSEHIYIKLEDYERYLYISDLLNDDDIKYIKNEFPHKIVTEDDLVVANTGSPGKVFKGKYGILSNNLFRLTFDSNVADKDYLYYILSSETFQNSLQKQMKGGIQKHLGHKTIGKQKIPLPPLPQQKKIAAILDAADTYRQKTKTLIDKYDELTQSLFLDMFGDPFDINSKYEKVDFEELTNRITYGFTKPMKHLEEGIHILTAKNIQNGYIDYNKVHFADIDEFNELTNKSKPEKNDILITKDGSIGRTALLDADFPVCINQSVALVKPKFSLVNPIYLVGYLTSTPVQSKIQNMGKGGGLKHLQITELAKFPTVLPSLYEQDMYSERVQEIEKQKTQAQQSLAKAEELFNSLLQKAFKGELL